VWLSDDNQRKKKRKIMQFFSFSIHFFRASKRSRKSPAETKNSQLLGNHSGEEKKAEENRKQQKNIDF
jgi:hypothetical protein